MDNLEQHSNNLAMHSINRRTWENCLISLGSILIASKAIPNDFTSNMLPSRLFVVHDASRCGEDDISKLTRRQKLHHPLLEICNLDVVARANHASLIDSRNEIREWVQG